MPRNEGGRPKGSRNKATIERERKALADLQKRAAEAIISPFAKDELAALIPEGKELLGIVKGIVARFQRLAIVPDASDEAWSKLKEWLELYSEVMLKLSQIEYRAADFQSPKFRAIAVHVTPDLSQAEERADNVIPINDPVAASRVYQRRMQGGR